MKIKKTIFKYLIFSIIIFSIIGFIRNESTEEKLSKNENNPYMNGEPNNPLVLKIADKLQHESFVNVSLFNFNSAANKTALKSFVNQASFLKLSKANLEEFNTKKPVNINFVIPVNENRNIVVELTKVSLFTKDYEAKNPNIGTFYQGIIKDNPNSMVAISIFDKWVMGMISTHEGNFVLGTIKENNRVTSNYILYNDRDLFIKNKFICMTDDVKHFKGHSGVQTIFQNPNTKPYTVKPIRLYYVADYQMYLDFGGNETVVKQFITGAFNQVNSIYTTDATKPVPMAISDIYVYTSSDPYEYLSDSYLILTAFGNVEQDKFNGDVAQFLTTGHGGGLGGIAWINVLCASYNPADSSGRFSFCNIDTTYNAYPTYSWTVEVMAHELGHNIASRHTHACVWPVLPGGGIGAIDSCYYAEGYCFDGYQPNDHGTIMSYCHLYGHIDFLQNFGPLPRDTIFLGYSLATCIDTSLNISEIPVAYSLLQNFPNPFNPATNIEFALPNDGFVNLSVYDLTGKEVGKLINNTYYHYGIYKISFDANHYKMASGVYLYRINVYENNKQVYSDIKKMVLIK